MTSEQRKEYMREYRKKNKDRIKESKSRSAVNRFLKSIKGDSNAVIEWIRHHKMGDGWLPIQGWWRKDGFPVVVLHNEKSFHPYCIQCAGSGSYFETIEEIEDKLSAMKVTKTR